MARTVVTGGAGFIGSHLGEALARAGHEVVLLDNLDSYYSAEEKQCNIEAVTCRGDARLVEADVRDIDAVRSVIHRGTDFVFHQAAQAGIQSSVDDPVKTNSVNVQGTLNVLLASLEGGVRRVVNASSSSVYGRTRYLPLDEEHPTEPVSPYGVSKLAAEHYARVFYQVHGLPTVSLRYFNVYGPRMRPDLAIHIFARRLLEGEPLTIFGDGEQTRDFTFIDDVVAANLALLDTGRADGRALNIGSSTRVSVNELARRLAVITGSRPRSEHVAPRKGDARDTHASVKLAGELIGYEPAVELDDGLRRLVDWLRSTTAEIQSRSPQ
jgi:UDP-glucose 4-epimerase